MFIRALLLTFLLSSCADSLLVGFGQDTNYMTFDHSNSEKAIADVRTRAEIQSADDLGITKDLGDAEKKFRKRRAANDAPLIVH